MPGDLFENALNSFGLVGSAGAATSITGNLLNEVLTASGGLPGSMSRFDQSGFGERNAVLGRQRRQLPISPREIEQLILPDRLDQLAHLPPRAIDSATPGGEVP